MRVDRWFAFVDLSGFTSFGDQYGDGNESVQALSASLLVRHTWRPSSRIRPYVEAASGPIVAEKRVPAATSRFNFEDGRRGFVPGLLSGRNSSRVFNAAGRVPLFAGYRFLHISNGGYAPRNPGLNVSAAVFGVQLRNARPRRH